MIDMYELDSVSHRMVFRRSRIRTGDFPSLPSLSTHIFRGLRVACVAMSR